MDAGHDKTDSEEDTEDVSLATDAPKVYVTEDTDHEPQQQQQQQQQQQHHEQEKEEKEKVEEKAKDDDDSSTGTDHSKWDLVKDIFDVGSSSAFQILDKLLESEVISEPRASQLKQEYKQLVAALKREMNKRDLSELLFKSFRSKNKKMLSKLKDLESLLLQDGEEGSVVVGRRRLLTYKNKLELSVERTQLLIALNEKLQKDQGFFEAEYNQFLKDEALHDIEAKIEHVKAACGDLSREIREKMDHIDVMKEDLGVVNRHVAMETRVVLELQNERNLVMADAVAASVLPRELSKACERLHRQKKEQKKLTSKTDAELNKVASQSGIIRQKLVALNTQNENLLSDTQQKVEEANQWEKKLTEMQMRIEEAANEDMMLTESKAYLLLSLDNLQREKQILRHNNILMSRQVDNIAKEIRIQEAKVKHIDESIVPMTYQTQKLTRQLNAMTMTDTDEIRNRKKALQREVVVCAKSLAIQESRTDDAKLRFDNILVERKRLQGRAESYRQALKDLVKHTTTMNQDIEHRAIDRQKLSSECRQLKSSIILKVSHARGLHRLLQQKLQHEKELKRLTDVVKTEGLKLYNLNQLIRQKITQMNERRKLFVSDVKILNEKAVELGRLLENVISKKRSDTEYCIQLRKQRMLKRAELDQLDDELKEMEQRVSHMRSVSRLRQEELQGTRQRLRHTIISRNKMGFDLLERNEEVSVLYDRMKIQGEFIDDAELALRLKTDELTAKRLKLADEQRSHKILCIAVEKYDWLAREYYRLSDELCKAKERRIRLEAKYENARNPKRVRFLKGQEPDALKIKVKSEMIQMRLTDREIQLREKQLVSRRLDRLTDLAKREIDCSKSGAQRVAMQANSVRRSLRIITRQMMASVAELSIYKAQEMNLSQILHEQLQYLDRMRSTSTVRPNRQRKYEDQRSADDDNCDKEISSLNVEELQWQDQISYTTDVYSRHARLKVGDGKGKVVRKPTIQRPDFYLPEPFEPCLPRPYGAHGPFMPKIQRPCIKDDGQRRRLFR